MHGIGFAHRTVDRFMIVQGAMDVCLSKQSEISEMNRFAP